MKVKALKKFETIVDSKVNRTRKCGEVFEADKERVEQLLKANLIEVLEKAEPKKEVAEPEVHEAVVEEKKVKKAVKKSTKKKAVVEE